MSRLTPREIASRLSLAIPDGTPIPDLMIGIAAFVSAIIYKGYQEEMREQVVVAHANTVIDMLARVESQEVQEAAQEDAERDAEDAQEALTGKRWMQ